MTSFSRAIGVLAVCGGAWPWGCKSGAADHARTVPSASAASVPSASAASAPSASAASAPSSAPASTSPTAVSPLDEIFRRYRQKLPEPADMSDANGASLRCARDDYATYNHLATTAAKLPIKSNADLPRLVPWARDDDPCIRQIALEAIVSKIRFDSNRLVLPDMHEPEHYLYHDIFVSLKAHLERMRVAHEPKLFAGMMLDLGASDFGATLHGNWTEDVGKMHNFQTFVEIDAQQIRVTRKLRRADPAWPDRTATSRIKNVSVNKKRQFVVTTSDQVHLLWPVGKDTVWFDDGRTNDWQKLRRAAQ